MTEILSFPHGPEVRSDLRLQGTSNLTMILFRAPSGEEKSLVAGGDGRVKE
jgi:hypothetical protein